MVLVTNICTHLSLFISMVTKSAVQYSNQTITTCSNPSTQHFQLAATSLEVGALNERRPSAPHACQFMNPDVPFERRIWSTRLITKLIVQSTWKSPDLYIIANRGVFSKKPFSIRRNSQTNRPIQNTKIGLPLYKCTVLLPKAPTMFAILQTPTAANIRGSTRHSLSLLIKQR
jgi:hypothetical protein